MDIESHASLIKLFQSTNKKFKDQEGINRKFLIDTLRETMDTSDNARLAFRYNINQRHLPTRRQAVRRAHVSTVVKNRNDERFTHRLEQGDINHNIDLINNFA